MTLNYVALTGDLGTAGARGTVTLTPSGWLTDSTDELLIPPEPQEIILPAAGTFSVSLLATDNPAPQPQGWTWAVSIQLPGINAYGFSFDLPAGPLSFTATDASPCVFTAAGSSYIAGTGVQLSGGSLPGGFEAGTTYYVVNPSGTTFGLAVTSGGPALGSTSSGSGDVLTVSTDISAVAVAEPASEYAAYMPLPSGSPAAGLAPVATGNGEASEWGAVLSNPMTSAGDMITGGVSGAAQRLAGNVSSSREFLLSQGTASAAQQPSWTLLETGDIPAGLPYDPPGAAGSAQAAAEAYALALQPTSSSPLGLPEGGTGESESTPAGLVEALGALLGANNLSDLASRQTALNNLAGAVTAADFLRGNGTNVQMSPILAADLPTGTTSAKGALQLEGTASAIQNCGPQAAGTTGLAPDAGHVHFCSGMYLAAPLIVAPGSVTPYPVNSTTMTAFGSGTICTPIFSAPASGAVVVTVSCCITLAGSLVYSLALAGHGSVTPLSNVLTGGDSSNAIHGPKTWKFYLSGLSGSGLAFDLICASTGSITIEALGSASATPTGVIGGPYMCEVQAV
jgi:hypothetical protein